MLTDSFNLNYGHSDMLISAAVQHILCFASQHVFFNLSFYETGSLVSRPPFLGELCWYSTTDTLD